MSWFPYTLVVYLFLIGMYGIVTSRNLIHLAVCLNVVQSATYVLLLTVGYREGARAPIIEPSGGRPPVVDPLVQSLALTDIVVGATVTALLLALAIQLHKHHGTLDPNELGAQRG